MENWQKFSYLDKEKIRKIQSKKFVFAIRHLVPYSPFYQDFFKKHNLSFGDFKSIDDIVKLPIISKHDILPTDEDPAKPKKFILQPDENKIKKYAPKSQLLKIFGQKIIGKDYKNSILTEFKPVHIHFTTGRSSNQIPIMYSNRDLGLLKATGERLYEIIMANKDDVFVNSFPYAPHLAFWLGFYATGYSHSLSLQTGGGKIMGTLKIIGALEKLKATILLSIPGYAYHLIRKASEQKTNLSSLKKVILGGERICPGLKRKIKILLNDCGAKNVEILATYALTEGKTAWVQCHEESGYHLYPDIEYVELVDKNDKPVKEGEKGEVVYTALDWRCSFVMRYRTADICESLLSSEPCKFCGRTVPRLHYDIERQSEYKDLNISKVKGELVNMNSFYEIINNIDEIEEWQVELKKKNNDPFELDEVFIHISLKKGADPTIVEPKLEDFIIAHTNIRPTIINYPLPKLLEMLGMEKELKEKRIVDNRKIK